VGKRSPGYSPLWVPARYPRGTSPPYIHCIVVCIENEHAFGHANEPGTSKKTANKNLKKILLDSSSKSQYSPLKTTRFHAELSPKSLFLIASGRLRQGLIARQGSRAG